MFKYLLMTMLAGGSSVSALAESGSVVPFYQPSSNSQKTLDISSNAYGKSALAPAALAIGEAAPDFSLASAGGAEFRLVDAISKGPVVIVFYRGHW